MPKPLAESTTLAEATSSTDTQSGVLEVEFITPGWGSSGYYSPAVVEAAAPLFTVGTHMYFDHPSATENQDRPERSVRDLAAVIIEAGTVDKTTGGVRGKVKPLAPYRELLTDEAFTTNVGVSIRGSATDIVEGEAEGRRGPIIEGLADIASVDFVTRAGRGGRVLSVLESAGVRVDEATANDRRSQLRDVVRAAYPGPGVWAYVHDIDAEASTVWFEVNRDNGPSVTYEQAYSVGANDVDVTLTGTPTEVRRLTKYVSVTRPDSTTPTTEADLEVTMGKIQIEESEHTRLTEKAGRVDALLTENATLKTERDQLREEKARTNRITRAGQIVEARAKDAGVSYTPLEVRGFCAELPIKEDGTLDEAAFTTVVDTDAATRKAAAGTGSVTGFGGGVTEAGAGSVTLAQIDEALGLGKGA